MDDYVSKPLRKQTLRDVLVRWIPDPSEAGTGNPPELLHEAVIAEIESLDGGMLADLVSLYFTDAAGYLCELSTAIGQGEMDAVGETAHKLEGSSGTLGAAQVSSIAAELEELAIAGDQRAAGEVLTRLRSGLAATQQAFRARIPEPRPVS